MIATEPKKVSVTQPSETSPKHKIYCSFGHTGESNWLQLLGFEITHKLEDADLVLFGGGKDIYPGFYNEKTGSHTDRREERDNREKADFDAVQALRKQGKNIKTVGICRG